MMKTREQFIVELQQKGFEVTSFCDGMVQSMVSHYGSCANWEKITITLRKISTYIYDEKEKDVKDIIVDGCSYEYERFSENGEWQNDVHLVYHGEIPAEYFFEKLKELRNI